MLLTTLILVPIYCEHDCLQKGINLSHCYETTERCDMPRFGL